MARRFRKLTSLLAIGGGAGIIGGIVFGIGLMHLGAMPVIASLVGSQSVVVGWLLNLAISAGIGASFGLLFHRYGQRLGASLAWGFAYGLLWWFLGALTGVAVIRSGGLEWSIAAVRSMFPSLIDHMLFGLVLGGAFTALWRVWNGPVDERAGPERSRLLVFVLGAVAGLIALAIYRALFGGQGTAALRDLFVLPSARLALLGVAAVLGSLFGLLFDDELTGHGSSLAWGLVFAFAVWILVPLTARPLLHRADLRWSLAAAESTLGGLVGLLLFGALMALTFYTLTRLQRVLFSDRRARARVDEGIGARNVRAVIQGVVASVAGGIAFSVVMVWMDLLPTVAGLVGGSSAIVGFVVHMVISAFIGGTFGLLFRREATTLGAGVAWGLVYGFLWWLLGPLTLMPRLLGSGIVWSAAATQAAFPSLVGHLAYGAATALVFQLLASRYELRAEALTFTRRRRSAVAEAAALWAVVLLLGLVLPLLIAP